MVQAVKAAQNLLVHQREAQEKAQPVDVSDERNGLDAVAIGIGEAGVVPFQNCQRKTGGCDQRQPNATKGSARLVKPATGRSAHFLCFACHQLCER